MISISWEVDVRKRPAAGQLTGRLFRLSFNGEELGKAHCERHVACDLYLASHEGVHRVQFALGDVEPILIADSEGHIWLLDATGDEFALLVSDPHCPFTGLIAGNVPLKGFVQASCR